MTDQVTVMTDFHQEVIKTLERMGIGLMYEIPFPPYQVDIYVPDSHAAIECDGPYHGGKRDRKKDEVLSGTYKLWVCRVPLDEWRSSKGSVRDRMWTFVKDAQNDAVERFNAVQDRVPWL